MMKVKLENNVLTVITDIKKETVEKGIASLKATDEKGNEVYAVSVASNGVGSLFDFNMVCNTYIDGKLALTMLLPMNTTKEDVQRKFGEKLVAAKKYTAQIAGKAIEKEAAIDAIFAE